ncbi:Ribonuclease H-like domain,Zinc finger C2H2-type,Zinc finger, BED-type,HAT, C-terminal dimerisation, partial [Cinara cedri]
MSLWACHAEAVKAIKNNYNGLITVIDEICQNTSVPEMRAKGIDYLISGINLRFKQDTIGLINGVPNILNLNITTEITVILEKFAKISPDTLIAEIKNIPEGLTTNESVFLWLNCKSSVIWDYFQLDQDNINVKCGLCHIKLKNNRTSTSNLIRHMMSKHLTVSILNRNVHVLEETIVDQNHAPSTSTTNKTVSTNNFVVNKTVKSPQIPSIEYLLNSRPQSSRVVNNSITQYLSKLVSASPSKIIDQQVLQMIVKSPFSIIEDREFVKLLNSLNPGYTFPSKKTLTQSLLPVMYNEVYEQVKEDIQEHAKYISITTDSWTSIKNENYTAVTCHFIDNKCELKKFEKRFIGCYKEMGLENKIAACTTDNAYNIVNAISKWRHVGCFAHSLNLAVQTALKSILETREKVRGIVGHFKSSPQASENLKTMQEQLGLTPPLMLIQDVITRLQCNYNIYLTNEDWYIISKSFEILKYFKEITLEISSEKSNRDFKHLKKYKFMLKLQYSIRDSKKWILQHQATVVNIGNLNNIQPVIPNQTSILGRDSIWNEFNEVVSSQLGSTNSTSAAIVEIDKYLQEGLIPRHECPLKWWKDNQNVYPRLFENMKKRLCVLATSVPCERIFSKTWRTLTEKRSSHTQSSRVLNNSITQYLSKPVGVSRLLLKTKFVKLLNLLDPGYTLPSRKTLTKSLLPVIYNEVFEQVKQDIQEHAKYVSITTNSWTSIKNENYIALTCHFIDNECESKSYLLSCFKNSESHSSENLKNYLLAIQKIWILQHQFIFLSEGRKTLISRATVVNIKNLNNIQPVIPNKTSILGGDFIWNEFDEVVSSQLRSTNPTFTAIVEIDKYLQEGLILRHESPLKWWKDNKNVYPCLFELMKKRLCVLATSVPCERIFSKAGQTLTEKR